MASSGEGIEMTSFGASQSETDFDRPEVEQLPEQTET